MNHDVRSVHCSASSSASAAATDPSAGTGRSSSVVSARVIFATARLRAYASGEASEGTLADTMELTLWVRKAGTIETSFTYFGLMRREAIRAIDLPTYGVPSSAAYGQRGCRSSKRAPWKRSRLYSDSPRPKIATLSSFLGSKRRMEPLPSAGSISCSFNLTGPSSPHGTPTSKSVGSTARTLCREDSLARSVRLRSTSCSCQLVSVAAPRWRR